MLVEISDTVGLSDSQITKDVKIPISEASSKQTETAPSRSLMRVSKSAHVSPGLSIETNVIGSDPSAQLTESTGHWESLRND